MESVIEHSWYTFAERSARLVRDQFHKDHPSWQTDEVPLDELVVWLGLDVETFHAADYPEGTFGFMDPDEDENLVWLRRNMLETLRRFTLAHELGHAVLHCHGN